MSLQRTLSSAVNSLDQRSLSLPRHWGNKPVRFVALGYIADSLPIQLEEAPDPRDLIHVVSQIQLGSDRIT